MKVSPTKHSQFLKAAIFVYFMVVAIFSRLHEDKAIDETMLMLNQRRKALVSDENTYKMTDDNMKTQSLSSNVSHNLRASRNKMLNYTKHQNLPGNETLEPQWNSNKTSNKKHHNLSSNATSNQESNKRKVTDIKNHALSSNTMHNIKWNMNKIPGTENKILSSNLTLRASNPSGWSLLEPSTNFTESQKGLVNGLPEVVIFYHIFISPENPANAIRIINEQLNARAVSPNVANATLYYTRVGDLNATMPSCHNCHELARVDKGDEILTLQAMFDYCSARPSSRVVYIHDKGSYTRSRNNELHRRMLTKAAFSRECTDMPVGECDICSSQFSPLPFLHTAGNMFVAECSYVAKLIPPNEYGQRKEEVIKRAWNATWQELGFSEEPTEVLQWQFERPSWMGLGRYAMEHWLHNHPDSTPCDIFHDDHYSYQRPPLDPDVLEAKRQVASPKGIAEVDTPFHPYFTRAGRLYDFQALYSKVPSNDSWFYSYYKHT